MTFPLTTAVAFGELDLSIQTVLGLLFLTISIFAAVAISSITLFKELTKDN